MLPLGLIAFGQGGVWVPPAKKIMDFCEHPSHLCVLAFVKPRNQKVWGWGGQLVFQLGAEYCVTYYRHRGRWSMSVGKGVRSWCRGQKSGQLCPLLLRILSILQHVFQRNSFFFGDWSFPSSQTGCHFWSVFVSQRQSGVGRHKARHIVVEFIPMSLTGRASTTNSISMLTALLMMSMTSAPGRWLNSLE